MTVIRPNSISGITSITAQANEINIFRSDGTLAGLQLNGVNFNNTSGISTLAALNVTGNVSIAGTLTYQDVTNVDSVGVITARSGINVSGGGLVVTGISTTTARLDVGNNGTNAVDLRFRSNRASAGQTIANLNYEWNGTTVAQIRGIAGSDTTNKDDGHLAFYTTPAGSGSFSERLRIDSNGDMALGGSPITSGYTSFTIHEPGTSSGDHVRFNMTNGNTGNTASDGFSITVNGSTKNTHLIQRETADMVFQTNGGERFRITSGGDLRLGLNSVAEQTDSAHYIMTLTGKSGQTGAGAIAFKDPSANTDGFIFADGGNLFITADYSNATADSSIRFRVDGSSEKLRIDASGKVGINGASTNAMLEVRASNTTHGIKLIDASNSGGSPAFEIISKRSDGNVNTAFSSNIFLGTNRTDQKVANGKFLGTVAFGGNHTDGSEGNISYAAAITARASGDFNSKSDMPTDLIFTTGVSGTDKSGESAGQSNVGTERMRISSTGAVTKPALPYFYATATPTVGSNNIHSFGNVHGNNGNHYNNSNGRFVAPVSGFYWFACGIWCNSSSTNTSYLIQLQRYRAAAGSSTAFAGANHRTQYNSLNCSGGTYMEANDYVWIQQTGISIQPSTPRNYFSGYLVG